MFIDASAIVAIITSEPDAEALAARLETATAPITSPLALYEAALAIRRKRRSTLAEAQEDLEIFLATTGTITVPITAEHTPLALAAFARYGKGTGHPAQLNLADCFAYAAAKHHHTSLLFTGEDFTQTDLHPTP